jgi:hypothetical protein
MTTIIMMSRSRMISTLMNGRLRDATGGGDLAPSRPDPGNDTAAPRAAPDDARCPRCGRDFHCGMNDATPCACTTLRLSAATLSELRARHRGCLCLQCLRALAHGDASGTPPR